MKRIDRDAGTSDMIGKGKRQSARARTDTLPVNVAASTESQSNSGADAQLGPRIRALRLKAGLTLAELSKATGVAIGALSQLERGLVSPNVRTVFTVSHVLGVSAASLIDPANASENGESTFIVRANRRRRLLDSGGVRKDVASPVSSQRLRSYYMVIEPGCGSGPRPYTHEGEELGIVLSGRLELEIDGERYSLMSGDSFAFASDRPHQFLNVGATPATVFWVNASP